jgi:hypothetical protein
VSPYRIREGSVRGRVVLPTRCDGGLDSARAINMYVGGGQALLILNLGTRWGEWLAAFTERFTSDKQPPLPIEYGTGWAWDPVWTLRKLERFLPLWNIKQRFLRGTSP